MFEIITITELLKRLDSYNHKELHVHHAWEPSKEDFNGSNGLQLQESMRNYHVNTLGWADIGQHVTLLPDGKFVTGRPFGQTPASIAGYNTGGFAVEMLGNFDAGHDVLEGPQKASILRLAKYFDDKGRYIRFHRENSTKTCPGSGIDKTEFMGEVKGIANIPVAAAPAVSKPSDNMTMYLQKTLNRLWFTDANNRVLAQDGVPGANTGAAIKKFQDVMNLSVDGVAGTITQNAINDVLLKPVCSVSHYNRNATRYIQWRLGIPHDGVYGAHTKGRVKSYQIDKKIESDGIFGPASWHELIG